MTGKPTHIKAIADRFGGQTALARAIGSNQSTVWDWVDSGRVPSSKIADIIRAGARHDPPIVLEPNDFFVIPGIASARQETASSDAEAA